MQGGSGPGPLETPGTLSYQLCQFCESQKLAINPPFPAWHPNQQKHRLTCIEDPEWLTPNLTGGLGGGTASVPIL